MKVTEPTSTYRDFRNTEPVTLDGAPAEIVCGSTEDKTGWEFLIQPIDGEFCWLRLSPISEDIESWIAALPADLTTDQLKALGFRKIDGAGF
jgi:hypothetical protein